MSTIQPISIENGRVVAQTRAGSGLSASNSQKLQDQFMNLLISQMKNQNPLEPLKNDQFLAQTAQFQSLQELQRLNATMTSMIQSFSALTQLNNAASLIGKEATVSLPDGKEKTGLVSGVSLEEGGVMLQIGAESVPLGAVKRIGLPKAIDETAEAIVQALMGTDRA
jgi:flagellar basal-body rod modification protein FlgD